MWRRSPDGALERVYAGEGSAYSAQVDAWLFAVDEGRKLRIADDREGTSWWPTAVEAERAAKEAERAAKEAALAAAAAERAEKEAALARLAELEAELRRRGG